MEVQVNDKNVDRVEDTEAVHEKLPVPLTTEGNGQGTAEAQSELIENFNLDDIERDEGLQARAQLDQETIDSYAEEMKREVKFPPVDIFHDGTRHWLADGHHRVAAAGSINAPHIRANVRQGTRRDALLHAAGSNVKNGLRRSNADKRKAVTLLLHDEECLSWSDHKVAEHAGVDHKTVGKIRKELVESGEIPQIAEVMVGRGNQSYPMAKHKKSKSPEALDTVPARDKEDVSQTCNPQSVEHTAPTGALGDPDTQAGAATASQDTSADQHGSKTTERIHSPSASEKPLASEADVEQVERPESADFKQRLIEVITEYVQQHPNTTEEAVQTILMDAYSAWLTQRQATQHIKNA